MKRQTMSARPKIDPEFTNQSPNKIQIHPILRFSFLYHHSLWRLLQQQKISAREIAKKSPRSIARMIFKSPGIGAQTTPGY
jgi:hypothetical protein